MNYNNLLIDETQFENVSMPVVQSVVSQQLPSPQNMLENIVFIEPQVLPVPDGMCKTCYDSSGNP